MATPRDMKWINETAARYGVGGDLNAREMMLVAIEAERERCATVALEQRCERGNGWDLACVAIARIIRNEE